MYRVVSACNRVFVVMIGFSLPALLTGCAADRAKQTIHTSPPEQADQTPKADDPAPPRTESPVLDERRALLIAQERAFNAHRIFQPIEWHASREDNGIWAIFYTYGQFDTIDGRKLGYWLHLRDNFTWVTPDGCCHHEWRSAWDHVEAELGPGGSCGGSRFLNEQAAITLARAYNVQTGRLPAATTTEITQTEDGGYLVIFNDGIYIPQEPVEKPPSYDAPVVVRVKPNGESEFLLSDESSPLWGLGIVRVEESGESH